MGKRTVEGRYRTDRPGNHARAIRKRRVWPWVLSGAFVVLLGIGAVGGIFALQAFQVRDDLLVAKEKLATITDLVKAGDAAQLQTVADDVLALTTHADSIVQTPLWDAAAAVPAVGENVSAVRGATVAANILVRDALPAGVQLLSSVQLDELAVEGGGINLDPFRNAIDILPQINSAFADAQSHVASIDRARLLPVVDTAIGQLLDVMDDAGPALAMVDEYLPTLLDLAGAQGPRTYLVIFQNNAEIRATGGNGANGKIIRIDNGAIAQIEDPATEGFFLAGYEGQGSLPFAPETDTLYEWETTLYSQNYTRTPHFPATAAMYDTLWNSTTGGRLDGVISLDPIVLSYMLEATGPVALDDGGEINAGNAVPLLLSETYERFGTDATAADMYFAGVAGKVFDAISSGKWDPMTMFAQLQRGAEEQRLYAWFSRENEEAMAIEANVAGDLATDNVAQTQLGIYLNDAAYSKLEYYLSTSVEVACDPAARTVTTSLTMSSTVPGTNLSGYTLGSRNNRLGLPRTTMILDTLYFAPPGGTIVGSAPETSDIDDFDRSGTENGRAGTSLTLALPMGETRVVSFTSTLPEGELGPLAVRYSPTVTATPVVIADSCSALFPPADPAAGPTL